MENNFKIYDAYISEIDSYNAQKKITFGHDKNVKKIIGIKDNGLMIDIKDDRRRFRILTKENSNEQEYGNDYLNTPSGIDFVVFYKEHDFSKDSSLQKQLLQLKYNKIVSKLTKTERFYYADIDYVKSVRSEDIDYQRDNDEPKPILFDLDRHKIAIGIIRDDMFIDLKDYRKYEICQLMSDKQAIYVDENKTYAHNINEVNFNKVSEEVKTKVKEYEEIMKIDTPFELQHPNVINLFNESKNSMKR